MVVMLVVLFCAVSVTSQVAPEDATAVLAGPVIIDGELGLTIGYSKKVAGLHLVSTGRFGETVEAEADMLKLFKIATNLYIGPIAGGGVDWSDEAGTGGVPTTSYLFGATGIAGTYSIMEQIGIWSFWQRHITNKANNPIAGVGLYYKF